MTAQGYESVAFFSLAGMFEILERLRPAREVDRWRHLKTDLLSFALAIVMNRFASFSLIRFITAWAPAWMLRGWSALTGLPSAARVGIAVLLADFVIYWIHRAQHRFGAMWRTHAWHHSTQELYWFSGFRTSFLHTFLYNIPQTAIPILLLNLSTLETGIGYSIGVLIQFWEHTNLDVRIGLLKYVFITPDYHRVHHSVEHNWKNFGTTFSFWDRMFGTYYDPARVPAGAPLGLGEAYGARQMARMLAGV